MHFFRIKSGTGDEWLSRTVISSKREIFVICGEGLTLFFTCAEHLSAFRICLSCRLCPIRPYGAPSPRGEG